MPVVGMPRGSGRPACAPAPESNACAPTLCDGKTVGACAGYAQGIVCRERTCAEGMLTIEATCVQGACPAAEQKPCLPYACKNDGACRVAEDGCDSDADCGGGFRCDEPTRACVPQDTSTCLDDRTVSSPDGKRQECTPYYCVPGEKGAVCGDSCRASADCLPGYVCDTRQGQGTCESPEAWDAAASEGGCGCEAAGSRERSGALSLIASLVAIGMRGRRRRAGRGTAR